MWDYSEKVQEHFFNPKNAGAVADANAIGEVGSISCGDALRLSLRVDTETNIILDAGFQTFGCGSAIASSSALTEIIKGKSLDQALEVSNQDIADFLDGLPPEKMHCSVMGREALQAAIANYHGEEWVDDHEEGALLCKCFAVDEIMIENTVRENSLSTVQDVVNYTKAGGGCAACHEGIEDILTRVLAERGEAFSAEGITPQMNGESLPSPPNLPADAGKMTSLQRIRRIEQVIESVRPTLQADHGDIELVEVTDDAIYVNMTGACSGCQAAGATLGFVQQRLLEGLGQFIKVIPASQLQAEKLVEVSL